MKEKKKINTKTKIEGEEENTDIKSKVAKTKKVVEQIATAVIAVVFIFVIIVCLGLIVQIFSGKKPSFFGYRFYYILTDSMEPEYLVGDVILSKLTETEEERMKLKVGDVVTFHSTSLQGQVITHRVHTAPYEKDGKWYIETKGDNSPAVDKPVLLNNVEAVLVAKSKGLSLIYKAFTSGAGAIFLLVIPFALLLVSLVIRLIHQIKKPAKKVVTEEYKQKVIEEYLNKDEEYKQKVIDEYLKNQTELLDETKSEEKTTDISDKGSK